MKAARSPDWGTRAASCLAAPPSTRSPGVQAVAAACCSALALLFLAQLVFAETIEVLAPGTNVMCDSSTDDTQAIRTLISNANPGDTLHFPNVFPDYCRIEGHLALDNAITILGDGVGSFSELRRTDTYPETPVGDPGYACTNPIGTNCGGAIFYVTASNVTIEGMRLVGRERGNVNAANTHGIWAIGDLGAPHLENLTLRNNRIEKFRGAGASAVRADDVVIQGNDIREVGVGGILLQSVNRAAIDRNEITDVNTLLGESCAAACDVSETIGLSPPDTCPGNIGDPSFCQAPNSYGISVTGCNTAGPCSSDISITRNVVRNNPVWAGIMNHGGQRVRIDSNSVYNADFLFAQTVSLCATCPCEQSDDTLFINNFGDVFEDGRPLTSGHTLGPLGDACESDLDCAASQRCQASGAYAGWCRAFAPAKTTGLWLLGYRAPGAQNPAAIGNTLRNTGYYDNQSCIVFSDSSNARITHNRCERDSTPPETAMPDGVYGIQAVAGTELPQGCSVAAAGHLDPRLSHNYFVRSRLVYAPLPSVSNATIAHNHVDDPPFAAVIQLKGGSWDIYDNSLAGSFVGEAQVHVIDPLMPPQSTSVSEAAPPPPQSFQVQVTQAGPLELSWTYPSANTSEHDGFQIELSQNCPASTQPRSGCDWSRGPFRPANASKWSVASPSNPNWPQFDPGSYTFFEPPSALYVDFRIRALNGSVVSDWVYVEFAPPAVPGAGSFSVAAAFALIVTIAFLRRTRCDRIPPERAGGHL
ncbi:MAG: right-handed parallel beta-helix repeat-containing protein [Myxococcota bacterium]